MSCWIVLWRTDIELCCIATLFLGLLDAYVVELCHVVAILMICRVRNSDETFGSMPMFVVQELCVQLCWK
jgi:hypothetical protein